MCLGGLACSRPVGRLLGGLGLSEWLSAFVSLVVSSGPEVVVRLSGNRANRKKIALINRDKNVYLTKAGDEMNLNIIRDPNVNKKLPSQQKSKYCNKLLFLNGLTGLYRHV